MPSAHPNKQRLFYLAITASALFWLGFLGFLNAVAHEYLAQLSFSDLEIRRFLPLFVAILILTVYIVDYLHKMRRVVLFRGHGAQIGAKQFPDIYERLESVCERLEMDDLPSVYILSHKTLISSSGVRYHNKDYLALEAETVGALTHRLSAIDYLIGYELARLHDASTRWRHFLWPATVLPLLGPAYARSLVYSFDRSGIAACNTKVDAALALAVRAVGTRRWKSLNIPRFASQSADNRSLIMSFNELISVNPWLPKRMAHLRAVATDSDTFIPRRNPLTYLFAALAPYINPRSSMAPLQLVLIFLWLCFTSFYGDMAYKQLDKRGALAWMEEKKETAETAFFTRKWLSPSRQRSEQSVLKNRYTLLHADLRQLGQLAKMRHKQYGDIPCEAGNIQGIKLNYRSSRYAYSCDEPVVYTRVAYGEFEPGRPAHVQSYNWEKNI
ncbi:MAG: hypothetical protein OEY67_11195, partial [Gammaproteobacteria bacterium]|nr:hypothetical protein [Gammaproteobacteria bacterium]